MTISRVEERTLPQAETSNGASDDSRSRRGLTVGGVIARAIIVALVVAAGVWAYMSNRSAPSMDMNMRVAAGSTPFPVVIGSVERGRIAGTVVYTGSVAPFNEEDVYPRVTGRIVDMPVYPGDAVRAGQVVARLDDIELGSKVREAEAGVAAANANVAQMDADVAAARYGIAQMEREVTMAAADAEHQEHLIVRDERLYTVGAISLQDLEATRAAVVAARARVDAARARVEQARAMEASAIRKRDAMTAMAAQSRAMQRTAEVVRDYVTITSPTSGYVVKRLVAPGVLVQPGMAILKIAQLDRVRLQANVGEKDVAAIRVGSPITVALAGTGAAPLTTRVTSVFPFVDAGARTAVVEAIVDNRDRKLLPGQYVRMELTTGDHADALIVPRPAVARLGGTSTVWVVGDGRVQPRAVTTGLESGDRIEILSGLQPGELIVVKGHDGLFAGAMVADASTPAKPAGHQGHGSATAPAGPGAASAPSQAPAPATSDPHKGMNMPADGGSAHKGMVMPKESSHAGH